MHQTCEASRGKSGAVDQGTALGFDSLVDKTGEWIEELEEDLKGLTMNCVVLERRRSVWVC
jgi:hypothetical protein